MRRRLLSMILTGMLAAACGSATPSVIPAATVAPTVVPTQAPTATPAPTSPFAGQDYALDLPAGWLTFDLSNPAGQAALNAYVEANPDMAASIAAFQALPNVTMAVNQLLGNVVISLSTPTGGLSLDVIGTGFTAQFAAVPGVRTPPLAEELTLPVGPALHWDIVLETTEPGGGTSEVKESVYLVANDATAILVEFVEVAAVGVPQEDQIIQSLRFTP